MSNQENNEQALRAAQEALTNAPQSRIDELMSKARERLSAKSKITEQSSDKLPTPEKPVSAEQREPSIFEEPSINEIYGIDSLENLLDLVEKNVKLNEGQRLEDNVVYKAIENLIKTIADIDSEEKTQHFYNQLTKKTKDVFGDIPNDHGLQNKAIDLAKEALGIQIEGKGWEKRKGSKKSAPAAKSSEKATVTPVQELPDNFSYLEILEDIKQNVADATSTTQLDRIYADNDSEMIAVQKELDEASNESQRGFLSEKLAHFDELKKIIEKRHKELSLEETRQQLSINVREKVPTPDDKEAKKDGGTTEPEPKEAPTPETQEERKSRIENEKKIQENIEGKMQTLGISKEILEDVMVGTLIDKDGRQMNFSPGQLLQVLDQFGHQMYLHIQNEAEKKHADHVAEGKKGGFFKGVARNTFKYKKIRDNQAEIASRILSDESQSDRELKENTLKNLVGAVSAQGYKVKITGENLDRYQVQYLDPEAKDGELPVDAAKAEQFNAAATNFARLPAERDLPNLNLSKEDRAAYEKTKAEYEAACDELGHEQSRVMHADLRRRINEIANDKNLSPLDRELKIKQMTDEAAVHQLEVAKSEVTLNQFNNYHPNIDAELQKIKSGESSFLEGFGGLLNKRNTVDIKTMGYITAGGAALRFTGKALTHAGNINLATAPLIGAVVGGFRGWSRAGQILRENEFEHRRGAGEKKDEKADRQIAGIFESRRITIDQLNEAISQKNVDKENHFKAQLKHINKEINKHRRNRTSKNFIDIDRESKTYTYDKTTTTDNQGYDFTEATVGSVIKTKKASYVENIQHLADLVSTSYEDFKKDPAHADVSEGSFNKTKLRWMERLESRLEFTKKKMDEGLINYGSEEKRVNNAASLMQTVREAQTRLVIELARNVEVNPNVDKRKERIDKALERADRGMESNENRFKKKQAIYGAGAGLAGGYVGSKLGEWAQPWVARHLNAATLPSFQGIKDIIQDLKDAFKPQHLSEYLNHAAHQTNLLMNHSGSLHDSLSLENVEKGKFHLTLKNSREWVGQMHKDDVSTPNSEDLPTGSNGPDNANGVLMGQGQDQPTLSSKLPPADADLINKYNAAHQALNIETGIEKTFGTIKQNQSYEGALRQFLVDSHKAKDLAEADKMMYHDKKGFFKNVFAEFGGKEPIRHRGDFFQYKVMPDGNIKLIKHPFDVPKDALTSFKVEAKVGGGGSHVDSLKNIISQNIADAKSHTAESYGFVRNSDPNALAAWTQSQTREIFDQNPHLRHLGTLHDGNDVQIRREVTTNGSRWKVSVLKGEAKLAPDFLKHYKRLHPGEIYQPENLNQASGASQTTPPVELGPLSDQTPPNVGSVPEKITGAREVLNVTDTPEIFKGLSKKMVESLQNYEVKQSTNIIKVIRDVCSMDPRWAGMNDTQKGKVLWGFIYDATHNEGKDYWNGVGIKGITPNPLKIEKGSNLHLTEIFSTKGGHGKITSLDELFREARDPNSARATIDREMAFLGSDAGFNQFSDEILGNDIDAKNILGSDNGLRIDVLLNDLREIIDENKQ